jgi:hypothetical protein
MQMALPSDSRDRAVLGIAETGDPLVVEGRFGAGRVVVFATDGSLSSIDPTTKEPWTYWPVWESFLPVVQETLRHVVGGPSEGLNTQVGMPLTGTTAVSGRGTRVVIRPPDADEGAIATTIADGVAGGVAESRWEFTDTTKSGIYRAETAPNGAARVDGRDLFAVNVDTAESDLARATSDDLPAEVTIAAPDANVPPETAINATGRDDWNSALLYGLLALVIAESVCAWVLGRRMA